MPKATHLIIDGGCTFAVSGLRLNGPAALYPVHADDYVMLEGLRSNHYAVDKPQPPEWGGNEGAWSATVTIIPLP